MSTILFAPTQPDAILDIARSLAPPGFELVVADPGTPAFYQAAADAEYYLGLARQMGGEFFRAAPKTCVLPSLRPISSRPARMMTNWRRGAGCQSRNWPTGHTRKAIWVAASPFVHSVVRPRSIVSRRDCPSALL